MKKLFIFFFALVLSKAAFSQACEPSYNDWITIDETQANLTVWQCYARAWQPSFANCPHDFTDCLAVRYNGTWNVENEQSDGQQLGWAVNDPYVRVIEMKRRKYVAFVGYTYDYLDVFVNRWKPASQYDSPANAAQICVPLTPLNNSINLLDACYWQTSVAYNVDPSGMHYQPIQTLPSNSFQSGKYGIVTNYEFFYNIGLGETIITTPTALDLTPFAVSSTSSPVYTIYCRWWVEVDFDNGGSQIIEKEAPVFYFQCNSRPNIEENALNPFPFDTILNTDPPFDLTPYISYTSPGVAAYWVTSNGEYTAAPDNLWFDPGAYTPSPSSTNNILVKKYSTPLSTIFGCFSNTLAFPITFINDPGTPATPELISYRYFPSAYVGPNPLIRVFAPFDNLLLHAQQEAQAQTEGIIGTPSSYGIPPWTSTCGLCPAPYVNYVSYDFYQKDSLGILQRNSSHLCMDKTYALPLYNPSGSLTYTWETNRNGYWQPLTTGTIYNIMEPDSGHDLHYQIRVKATNFLAVSSNPLVLDLNFHSKYKLPPAVEDSACIDSSYLDLVPYSNAYYLYKDTITWSENDFADSLNSPFVASRIFGNTHSMLVFDGADTVGYNIHDSLIISGIGEGLHTLPVKITSYYPFRQKNEPDNILPNINGIFDLANNSIEDNPHPLGVPAYDYGCICESWDTLVLIGKPTASVTYSLPDTVEQGYSTVFTTTVNNPNLDYVWTFSDDGLSYHSDPLHYFYDLGNQSVNLTITDEYGCSSNIPLNNITYVNLSYIGIEELENDFVIYPNPASDYLFIQSESGAEFSVELYNALGQKVFTGINSNSIELFSFAPGIYTLKVFSGGLEKSFKIVKPYSNN